ncbi:hypothetical protein IWX58_004804 [Rubrivivax gelatinosus]|nr:hypothetical protein [Rubrivivax gelatinosus]
MDDNRFPVIVRRRTCTVQDDYLGRLPDSQAELAEYVDICGLAGSDIYFQR